MWSVLLFADNRDPLASPEIIWGMIGITAALLVGAGVIYAVDKWRKRGTASSDADETASLTSFRAMFESGEITEAEYAELRRRVAEKMKKPAAATAGTPAPVGGTPAPTVQPGERTTTNPPSPPEGSPGSSPPPSSA